MNLININANNTHIANQPKIMDLLLTDLILILIIGLGQSVMPRTIPTL